MGAASYKNPDIDMGDVENLEDYVTRTDSSAQYLKQPVPKYELEDAENFKKRKEMGLGGLNIAIDWLIRDDDIPDYEAMLEDGYDELSEYDVDVDELELNHLDAEGYEEDALEDYREAIERVLEE